MHAFFNLPKGSVIIYREAGAKDKLFLVHNFCVSNTETFVLERHADGKILCIRNNS